MDLLAHGVFLLAEREQTGERVVAVIHVRGVPVRVAEPVARDAEQLREQPRAVGKMVLWQVRGEKERDRLRAQRLCLFQLELCVPADDCGTEGQGWNVLRGQHL